VTNSKGSESYDAKLNKRSMSNSKGINKKGASQTKTKGNKSNKGYQVKPTKRTLLDNVYYLGSKAGL
jgi:hypothetical protein